MKRSLDHYLSILKDYDPLTEERHAAIEARVRREIISRYGGLAIPQRLVVHTPELVRGGMLTFLMRPAFALAILGVLAVGAVAVMRTFGGTPLTVTSGGTPESPPPAVVVSTAPVEPGSGVAVSVFGIVAPTVGATTSPSAPTPTIRRVYRPRARPINPAEGVFTQWGQSVFSEEELLKVQREGKTI